MINTEFKNKLLEIYRFAHQYVYHRVSKSPENVKWAPVNSDGRSIFNYFRHLINVEIWWLYAFGDPKMNYIMKDCNETLQDLIDKYKILEEKYVQLLNDASEEELQIRRSRMRENFEEFESGQESEYKVEIVQRGTVAWTIFRITLHAFGHINQMTYILSCLGIHSDEQNDNDWWELTEKIISLGELAKV